MTQATTTKYNLSAAPINAVLSTTDLKRARAFYEGTLGLKVIDDDSDADAFGQLMFQTGNGTQLLVYHRPEPPKAENTVAAFTVSNVREAVDALLAQGVKFEEYDSPPLVTDNGVATVGDWTGAWFKDPDGNIIAVGQM